MKKLAELPRRTIEELALRYKLEPSMRDVFVEGQSDQAVIRWFIDTCCSDSASVAVITIDEIDVTHDVLDNYGLTSGNRSEVVALCLELESKFGNKLTAITGVVDLDVYSILDGDHECSILLKSDFSCIEMYLFSGKCLAKMLKLAFPKVKFSAKDVSERLSPILRDLFLTRAANQSLEMDAKWIPFDSFICVKGGNIEFRLEEFHRHYLQKGGVWDRRKEFSTEIETLGGKLPDDFRFAAHGHDAVCLLGHFLRSFYKKVEDADRTCPHVLIHLLTCSLESADVREMPMFTRLQQRISNPAPVP
jgi:hypothetical protein